MDSQIVQDLLPGTGSLGSVPTHHNYKRTVVRAAPKDFSVEVLPPKKFGSGYCYGLHVLPLGKAESSASSTKSGGSNIEYEVWRRWEDCLWFQDLLETEYKLMARTKRIRLTQGKGVKKNGVYLQSNGAASFDSLPPGPDASTIAKDVHDILPKLTKKGTLFKASQATIEQRHKEFSALIHALFEEDVPTLVKELRDNRIIRDFFGYWRRDTDHERKAEEASGIKSNRTSRASITSSAFSMYFSASNISLQLPGAFADIPPSPPIPSSAKGKGKERVITKSASFSSSSSASSRGGPQTPASAPAGLSFTVSDNGALIPTSPVSDDESYFVNGPSSAPLRSTSGRWSQSSKGKKLVSMRGLDSASESEDNTIMFVPEGPWMDRFGTDMHRSHNLEALPEEGELVPGMASATLSETSPPPARRPRNYSCPDPHIRNGLVFVTPPQGPLPVPEVHDDISVIDSIRGDPILPQEALPDTPNTNSSSSRHTSTALSNFSGEFSRRSSWRTSVDSITSVPVHEHVRDSGVDLDDLLCGVSPPSLRSPVTIEHAEAMFASARRSSVATMNSVMSGSSVDAVLPRGMISPTAPGPDLRRSLSTGSRVSRKSNVPSPSSLPTDEVWEEAEELVEMLDDDLLDAYFYDPGLRPPSQAPSSSGRHTPQSASYSFVPKSPQLSSRSGTPSIISAPSSPKPSHLSIMSLSPGTPSVTSDTFTIKAVRQESIVLIRANHLMTLSDIRMKIREKFASQEGVVLTDAFTIGFNPAVTAAEDRSRIQKGRPRSQSTSAIAQLGSQPRLRFLIYEEDWQQASSNCPGKMTLHIFDRF